MTEPKLISTEEMSRRVDEALTALNLPDDIIRWTSEPRTGWQGDPLVHVTFIVPDGFGGSPRSKLYIKEWTLPILDALLAALPDFWPITSYWSETEAAEIESGAYLR